MKYMSVLLVVAVSLAVGCTRSSSARGGNADPRIALFEKFNSATTYEEMKPLVSGVLASQLSKASTDSPERLKKTIQYLHVSSADPRVVEVNNDTSYLVLDNAKFDPPRNQQLAYLLKRSDGNWTIASRLDPNSVIKSLWTQAYDPSAFNQPSTCTLAGANVAKETNGKAWELKSAVAMRTKDGVEISLLPFEITNAEIEEWKFWSGVTSDTKGFQGSPLLTFHPECRIFLGLDNNQKIKVFNVGFNDHSANISTVFQLPDPKIAKFELANDRLQLDTEGSSDSGGLSIRWKVKINVPVLTKGL